MAEGSVHKEVNLEELEKDILCPVCQDHYTEPKLLPCLHYYCKKCIIQLAHRTATNQPFPCPECCKETFLPEGGVDELKTAFFVHRMESMYSVLEQVHDKVSVKCEGCRSGAVAVSFCRQCPSFICTTCVESHQRLKVFESHDVVSMSDLKAGRAKADISKEMPTPLKCKVHKESLKVYCFDCDLLICRDCTVKDHRDHNFEFCAVSAPQAKEKLSKLLEPLRKSAEKFSRTLKEVETVKQEVEAQGESVAKNIRSSFDELFEILNKRKQEMLEEARNITQKKIDRLSVQEKDLSLVSSKLLDILDQSDRFLKHCSDSEFMSMHNEIENQIEGEIEKCGKGDYINVVEEADMGVAVRCAEALQQLCQTQAKITRLAVDPALCVVRGEGLKTAEVNQTVEVTLTTKLANNKNSSICSIKISSQLKSLYDGSIIKCGVHQLRHSNYCIQYKPIVRGRHELSISVSGKEVAGSPFPVFVSISPTKLVKPVSVLDELAKEALDIAVNSLGQLVVLMDGNNFISIYDKGVVIKTVNVLVFQKQVYDFVGVAVDNEDNIYVTSLDPSILKMNKDGNLISHIKAAKSNGYLGVLVLEDEVMMCNEGLCESPEVVVRDKHLRYLRKITNSNFGDVRDISADSCKNIYLTDRVKGCVHVLNHHGDLLYSFSCDVSGVQVLTRPLGIHVAGQFVYVCNNGKSNNNHNVSVFTTEGRHVCTFGHKGEGEGEFIEAVAICLDSHGFVYVCDGNKNTHYRIQIF